jgi:hypothetical protein
MRLAPPAWRREAWGPVRDTPEKVFTLNPTARPLCETRLAATEQIASRLKDRFDDPAGSIESEVATLVAEPRQGLRRFAALALRAPQGSRRPGSEEHRRPGARHVAWQITNECNLACLHCIEESGRGKADDGRRGADIRISTR